MVKDYAYVTLFDKKDLPTLYKLAEKIRATHDISLIDNYNRMCQQKVDDHNPILQVDNQNIEFLEVSKSDDLVVTAGLNQCIDIILGVSSTRWQYVAIGTGTTAVSAGQTTLVTQTGARIDMNTGGWREYAGVTLRFAGIFGEQHSNVDVKECGIFTASSGGIMLNRNMFSTNFPTTHAGKATVISSVIEFSPVV
jgi:hypothetical protein